MPPARTTPPGGLASPMLNFGEDLSRFPSESLHSFSFAHQSEDNIHNRQNVLKRSIDFMRDRLGWLTANPGLVRAQAKVSGDVEIQSMMELLARANMLGGNLSNDHALQVMSGPLTGPAVVDAGNIFDRTFLAQSESPDHLDSQISPKTIERPSIAHVSSSDSSQSTLSTDQTMLSPTHPSSDLADDQASAPKAPSTMRPGLKRTYTDTSSLSMQTKLMEALAKPYVTGERTADSQLLSPSIVPSFGKSMDVGNNLSSVVHGHANRWVPAAQAIFTTKAEAPWTILAANDLACLVFGVTKAEVRKLGILEVVREDRREWLEEKLKSPGSEAAIRARSPISKSRCTSQSSSISTAVGGGGITAMLLSKPPARYTANRRAQTDDGYGSSLTGKKNVKGGLHHQSNKSRGVLLCGDVVPILKRNGSTGSASLWVKEKRGGLIWVLEEIVEDTAYLTLDKAGNILYTTGAVDRIWGDRITIEGIQARRLIPCLPKALDGVDYDSIWRLKHFTARNPDGYNIPVSVTAGPEIRELRVSSFPHIAGILVLSADTLKIISSNSVFSTALFGQMNPDGLKVTQLIPQFDKILNLLTQEDQIRLVDGIVIPEHSFRRARALIALREGHKDAAAFFLRPSGLVAKHRDGSELNVDVQMRVVKSETIIPEESVIEEKSDDETDDNSLAATSEVVYALWITYSRHLHSVGLTDGQITPLISRPGTPPRQPSPGQSNYVTPQNIDTEDSKSPVSTSPTSLLRQQIQEAASQPISSNLITESTITSEQKIIPPVIKEPPKKRAISDFVILEDMGQGAYGQVKLARIKKNPSKKVVLKYVTKKRILVDTWCRDRRLGTVPLEIHVLDYLRKDSLRHPNIVEMIDFFEDDINYYIEMVPHGLPGMDLFDYIELRSNMEEAECRNIFLQVVAALHHLHTKALVVHRDIKDENIVLDGEGNVKLIDFGSAAYVKNGPFDVFVGTIGESLPFPFLYSFPLHFLLSYLFSPTDLSTP